MSLSGKIYHFLLLAYPRNYRTRYAEPMEQLFRDRLREAHSFAARATLWARTLLDWAVTVPARHWDRNTSDRPIGSCVRFLKWHVRPLPHAASLEGLTNSYRRCIFFARHEASAFSCNEISPEHLVLGLLRQEPSLVSASARHAMARTIEANESATRRTPPDEDLRLSRASIRAVIAANVFARNAGRNEVAPRDLIAGILRERDTLAARLLRDYIPDI